MRKQKRYRPDKDGRFQGAFDRAKKTILATQDVCGICGKPVDKSLKYPHPLSPCIDHIIPISKGGHPSDIDNLQLAHLSCNRWKSDKILPTDEQVNPQTTIIDNRDLPYTIDWTKYRATDDASNADQLDNEMQELHAQGLALYPTGIRKKQK